MIRQRSILIASMALACSGENLYVGSDQPSAAAAWIVANGGSGGAATKAGGSPGATEVLVSTPWPAQTGCVTDPALAELLGTWEGDLEDFYFRPVEHVRIVINGASAQGVCGSVTWGTKPPFAPASDPNTLYPPSDDWKPFGYGGAPSAYLPPVEGFPYTITQGGERLPTLRLGVTQSEPWQSWCRIQTPVYMTRDVWPNEGYTCNHVNPACDETSNLSIADQFMCGACEATGPVCVCDASSCDVVHASPQAFDLTLSADGKTLSGAFEPAYALPQPTWESSPNLSLFLTHAAP